jgi:hypothetical protein
MSSGLAAAVKDVKDVAGFYLRGCEFSIWGVLLPFEGV